MNYSTNSQVIKREVLYFLSLLRESHPYMVDIYTNGSCLNLYLILRAFLKQKEKSGFLTLEPYYNVDHIITKISLSSLLDDFSFYVDITGEVTGEGYEPYKSYYSKKGFIRSFRAMYRAYWNK